MKRKVFYSACFFGFAMVLISVCMIQHHVDALTGRAHFFEYSASGPIDDESAMAFTRACLLQDGVKLTSMSPRSEKGVGIVCNRDSTGGGIVVWQSSDKRRNYDVRIRRIGDRLFCQATRDK